MKVQIYDIDSQNLIREYEGVEKVRTITLDNNQKLYVIVKLVYEPYYFRQEFEYNGDQVEIIIW